MVSPVQSQQEGSPSLGQDPDPTQIKNEQDPEPTQIKEEEDLRTSPKDHTQIKEGGSSGSVRAETNFKGWSLI